MRNLKRGFTLAEVMIVLTVIGVLTAILLPVARQSMPDENLMKFKKAHNTLGVVIRELITSGEYYKDGYFDEKPDGNVVDSEEYFCETLAEILNVKSKNCASDIENTAYGAPWYTTMDATKVVLDEHCIDTQNDDWVQSYIILPDDVVIYEVSPTLHWGKWDENISATMFRRKSTIDNINTYNVYKGVCIDIDGINQGEDPFGYGIRIDGKILTGARADEWLERDVNEE